MNETQRRNSCLSPPVPAHFLHHFIISNIFVVWYINLINMSLLQPHLSYPWNLFSDHVNPSSTPLAMVCSMTNIMPFDSLQVFSCACFLTEVKSLQTPAICCAEFLTLPLSCQSGTAKQTYVDVTSTHKRAINLSWGPNVSSVVVFPNDLGGVHPIYLGLCLPQ